MTIQLAMARMHTLSIKEVEQRDVCLLGFAAKSVGYIPHISSMQCRLGGPDLLGIQCALLKSYAQGRLLGLC